MYKRIAPGYVEEFSDVHRLEPYVYAQMVGGKPAYAKKPGEAKNSFLTGTAAWNFVAISQFILGIRPDYDGLVIDPCIDHNMNEFRIIRKFRGNTYEITVKNPNKVCCGVSKMIVDGNEVLGNVLKPTAFGDSHKVEVTLGE
jgi:cellobiose phosphorylase